MLSYVCLIILAASVGAIFEDQVGKFDWRNQYVGCPSQIEYHKLKPSQSDLIYLSSEANVIAAVKPTTGDIAWRHVLEPNAEPPRIIHHKKSIVSVGRGGQVIRAWGREKGLFVWETHLPDMDKVIDIAAATDGIVVILGRSAVYFLSLGSGEIKWSKPVENNKNWLNVVTTQRFALIVRASEGENITVLKLSLPNREVESEQNIVAPWYMKDRCSFIGTSFVCYDSQAFYVLNVASDTISTKIVSLANILAIMPLKVKDFVAFNTLTNTFVYELKPDLPQLVSSYEKSEIATMVISADDKKFLALFSHKNGVRQVTIHDIIVKNRVFIGDLKDSSLITIKDLTLAVAGREFELVIVSDDCRLSLYVSAYSELVNEWTRHEALSAIASVELVDLPLSEAQAGIESEFFADGGNIFESFARRILSQVNQLRRAIISASKEIFSTSLLINLKSRSISDWISSLSYNVMARSQPTAETPLERDYFNLRKIIVAATRKSTVYGLDSADGSVLWSLHLGKNMIPLKTSLDLSTLPLFIQRTTAHFQYAPRAVVVFADRLTSNGVIVAFNPVTGSFIERIDLDIPIKRVELLPFADADNLHHLLLIDASDKASFLTISLFPPYSLEEVPPLPTHLFSFDEAGHLEGFLVDFSQLKLFPQWKSTLSLSPSQKIITIVGKLPSQRVHSSGRVLGDRSVLYKYSNPNLVAIAVADNEHSSLHIHLIDAVTGYFVYSAKQSKVSGPFYFVHCENWLTYSYWNEKGRRTEIAVIELYEGLKQTNELAFSSLTPVISPVVHAVSQAYIFPQGISAMGVTDTEQGLSTRSILLALPFGNLYGISKRMLDPRRPLEMTPEIAEEMVIPYRPELPIVTEDFINYNQTVMNVQGIKATPSGLESTSLVLAYGLDMFFTRMTPSGTFDILKDDFDHKLISLVLLGLVLGSFICKKLGRNHTLKQAWQ